jgi:predicted HTH domain antitoxin
MATEPDESDEELARVVGGYALGHLTLGEAAERLDVSRWRMKEILEGAGVELRLGLADEEDARREVDVALNLDE